MQKFKEFHENVLGATIGDSLDAGNLKRISYQLSTLIRNFYSDVLSTVSDLSTEKEEIKSIVTNTAEKIQSILPDVIIPKEGTN